jgi:hypothetical protein
MHGRFDTSASACAHTWSFDLQSPKSPKTLTLRLTWPFLAASEIPTAFWSCGCRYVRALRVVHVATSGSSPQHEAKPMSLILSLKSATPWQLGPCCLCCTVCHVYLLVTALIFMHVYERVRSARTANSSIQSLRCVIKYENQGMTRV